MILHDFSDIFKPSWMRESEEEKSKRDQIKPKLERILNPSLLNYKIIYLTFLKTTFPDLPDIFKPLWMKESIGRGDLKKRNRDEFEQILNLSLFRL